MSPALRTLCLVALAAPLAGCQDSAGLPRRADVVTPDAARGPYVAYVGDLRGAMTASATEARLSEFLFGSVPEPPTMLVKPTGLTAGGGVLLASDPALQAVFVWDPAEQTFYEPRLAPRPHKPVALDRDAEGELLVVDAGARLVRRYAASGDLIQQYALEVDYRPADALRVNGTVWVSNPALHRIELFDAAGGTHRRSIGRRGSGPGEFGLPLGLARGPDGNVYVVDMLNGRVQVLAPDGTWLRDLGGFGNRVGTFGRPKDVAVAPDGTVFVSDAASQRIHVFASDGARLLAFGEADTGAPLALPTALAVVERAPLRTDVPFQPSYFLAVTEPLRDPGVRLFAWGQAPAVTAASFTRPARVREAASVENPHWRGDRCDTCHERNPPRAIPIARVDRGCLQCHDGVKAAVDPHPIARSMDTPGIVDPGWPLNEGRLSCLTCHDMDRHCSRDTRRPADNPMMLRGFDSQRPLDFCANCHVSDASWRVNPHALVRDDGAVDRTACLFCHEQSLLNGGAAALHGEDVCAGCHVPHWDYAPEGHLGKRPDGEMRRREAEVGVPLPLADGAIACWTCHNPHASGLRWNGVPVGTRASRAADARLLLRNNQLRLCLDCHAQ